MPKPLWSCVAATLWLFLPGVVLAQNPTVVGVSDDPPSSSRITSGALGYIFGSGFGTVENTSVTVGGRNVEVLEVLSNRIRVHFPPNLPVGIASVTVTVAGRTSEKIDAIVSPGNPSPGNAGKASVRRGFVSRGSSSNSALPYSPPRRREAPAPQPESSSAVNGNVSPTGVVYTCDATVTAASATACTTLNTTIAGLYSAAFSNANAAIYVKLGSTGLGSSAFLIRTITYSNFRNLLIAAESDATDTIAVADSVPAASPFGGAGVELTNANQRALGLTPAPTTGYKSNETTCTLGTTGCYDGVITVSNTEPLYFRTGSISGNQYDFFSVVEHETDEILGTASCAVYGCGGDLAPPDLFRYHSNGTRSSLAAGTNDSCSVSDSTNACFSLDGIHMLQQYNNVNNGDDGGDWLPPDSCANTLVQDASLCSGIAGVDISPTAEILVLDTVGYTHAAASSGGLQFYPVAPCRLVDTRGGAVGFNGIAPFNGPSIVGGATLTIPVQSATEAATNTAPAPCGAIPSTAQAYSLNITAVPQSGGAVDYVTVWPSGSTQPFVATFNDPQGQIVANAAIVPAGTPSGGISIYNAGPSVTDIVIDMNGYFAATTTQGSQTGLQFFPFWPCRLIDTRGGVFNGISPFSGPSISGGASAAFPLQSSAEATANTAPAPCGTIPSTAQAYSFNVTAVPQASGAVDYVSLWPSGEAQPFVSTFNDPQGQIAANAAIVPAGTPSGGLSIYNAGPSTTDIVVDMNGYFAPPAGLKFYPVSPCRLADTRGSAAGFNGIAPFSGPSIAAGGTLTIPVQSSAEAAANTAPAPCGTIPEGAQAYALNVTVVPHAGGAVDYVSLWPAGSPQPFVATLNDPEGSIVANAAIVPAGSGSGGISVYNAGPAAADIVIDMNGYFGP